MRRFGLLVIPMSYLADVAPIPTLATLGLEVGGRHSARHLEGWMELLWLHLLLHIVIWGGVSVGLRVQGGGHCGVWSNLGVYHI